LVFPIEIESDEFNSILSPFETECFVRLLKADESSYPRTPALVISNKTLFYVRTGDAAIESLIRLKKDLIANS